jgi:glycerol-3-phosphate dehydrogenase
MVYDYLIIGGGVIGAACAYELSRFNVKICVLEKENDVACGTSRANSGIIHAGYDPKPGSLMARLNAEGNALMEPLCRRLSIQYQNCPSLVLALEEQDLPKVQALYSRGLENGVQDLRLLSGEEVLLLEPSVHPQVKGALLAPHSGIISPWDLCMGMMETAVAAGTRLVFSSEVTGIHREEDVWNVTTPNSEVFQSKWVINASGLSSGILHEAATGEKLNIVASRGEYHLFDKSREISHVLFQVPSELGKGVLVSPTVHGNIIVGPNAQRVNDFSDSATTRDGLEYVRLSAKRSVPELDFRNTIRNFAGLRAQWEGEDFYIRLSAPNFLDFAGIQSPGLTSSPAIGKEAVRIINPQADANPRFRDERNIVHLRDLPLALRQEYIERNPAYGRILCRCEEISEGEVMDMLHSPIPPDTLDGVKRRTMTGSGRCQGGFCSPRLVHLLAKAKGISMEKIIQDQKGSYILAGETKVAQ